MSYTIKINTTEIQNNCVSFNISPKDGGASSVAIDGTIRFNVAYNSSGKRIWNFNIIRISTTTKNTIKNVLNSGQPFDFTPPGEVDSVVVQHMGEIQEQIYNFNDSLFSLNNIRIVEI